MMATISFYLATRTRNDKGKVFDEHFVGQLAVAIFSIYVVFQSTVGFFKTEPFNTDPLNWSWMIGSESWKVESEIIDLRASLTNIDLKSERGKAEIEELVRLNRTGIVGG
ncbi:MAG: hypothetical protein ACK5VS_07240 [Hyphomonadaceae bacterium]